MEWLSKKVVAGLVNQWFGHLIEDLSSQEVNDALLSGQVNLTNLSIRRDALSFLDSYYGSSVPIEVKKGTIGRVSLTIPYNSFFTQPLVVNIEDVVLLVTPVVEYDEEKEKELERARKRQKLLHIFPEPGVSEPQNQNVWGMLYNRLWNNLELQISNVHIRYEDSYTCPSAPLVIGLCLQSFTIQTTNHKWKKSQVDRSATMINKVIDIVSGSIYINPDSDKQRIVTPHINSDLWHHYLIQGLETFSINEEPFQFVLQPVRCKVKMRQQMMREARVPGLLMDAVIKDAALSLSQDQYQAITRLAQAFTIINVNRQFLKYRPTVPLKRHAAEWWQYAAKAIIGKQIRTFAWESIKKHREIYREYSDLYRRYLVERHSGELEADLLKYEDQLDITNIVLARMHVKIMISLQEPELVDNVPSSGNGWWSWLWGSSQNNHNDTMPNIIRAKRKNGVFSSLSGDERQQLIEALTKLEGSEDPERSSDDIDQKLYLSLQNISLTLRKYDQDVALATLSGLVLSAENRLGVSYQKLSAKTESLSIEAANIEQELVCISKLVEGTPTAGYGIAFSCDYECNPLNSTADYAFSMKLDPIELTYNQHACAEVLYFFQIPEVKHHNFEAIAQEKLQSMATLSHTGFNYAIARHKTVNIDIDIKSPFIVLPEYGSLQNGGNVLVIDMGGLKISNEIGGQTIDLESATRMELEEQLYDRVVITISHLQILLADSGDEWRVHRTMDDSDSHLLPRVQIKVNIANSIHPEYRQQPAQKVNIHITPLKINLSDIRLSQIVDFSQHLPAMHAGFISDDVDDSTESIAYLDFKHCLLEPTYSDLTKIRDFLLIKLESDRFIPDSTDIHSTPPLIRCVRPLSSIDTISQTSLELHQYFSVSEDDDEEKSWGKAVDMPGFEDNTSSSNMIKVLARFSIDELVISIAKSCDTRERERPYLMIKCSHFVIETALMDYGPAIQITLGSLHLVDKYHHSPTGEYLELISSPSNGCLATIMYRKVKSNCPEFATNFHSCEQSLVMSFTSLNIVCHRSAIISLTNYTSLLISKFNQIDKKYLNIKIDETVWNWMFSGPPDPPIPPGAVKWSFASHFNILNIKLCDIESDFVNIKVGGLQGEYVIKANDKKILRAFLSEIAVDDMSEFNLHPRILEIEEDRVLDIRYVHNSPTSRGVDDQEDVNSKALKPESSLRIRIGRVQIVFLCKFFSDLLRFMDPLISREGAYIVFKSVEKATETAIDELVSDRKLSLSIDIHSPTILVPQKSDSPSLLVLHLGDFKIDNMFKFAPGGIGGVVENILLEVGPLQVCRAVMTLGGGLEMQEGILEPATIKADIKRSLMPKCRDILSWDINVHIGALSINLGQRDLNTILAVISQNRGEAQFTDNLFNSRPISPLDSGTPLTGFDDNVGKLHAFLTHSIDIYHIADLLISLDGMTLTLYTDMDEVLSSPVRDAGSALARLQVGELDINGDMNSDHSAQLRLTLHSCDLFDVRPENNHVVKKIFGHHTSEMNMPFGKFSVSVPPMLDIMYKISPNGDAAIEITIERIRMNISVALGLALYRYVNDAIPNSASSSGGILNPGFIGDMGSNIDGIKIIRRPPSSAESTSGYLSTVTSNADDQRVLSFSLQMKNPELVIFADPEESLSRVLVVRCEIHMDYSRHPGHENFHFNLDKFQVFSTIYSRKNQTPFSVIKPCYIEGNWGLHNAEEGIKAKITVSNLNIYFTPPVFHLLMDFVDELLANLNSSTLPFTLNLPYHDIDDLWTPKTLQANISPTNPEDEPYIKPSYPSTKPKESLLFSMPEINISFEKQCLNSVLPVLCFSGSFDGEMNDWSKLMFSKAEIKLQISSHNKEFSSWEPILESVTDRNNISRPWEALIRTFRHPAQLIGVKRKCPGTEFDSVDGSSASNRNNVCVREDSESSTDEEAQHDNEMLILKPQSTSNSRSRRSTVDKLYVSGHPMDSDSETEDGLLHKISDSFSHMFSSESEGGSEDELSSDDLLEDSRQSERTKESSVSPKPNRDAVFGPASIDGEHSEYDEDQEPPFANDMADSIDGIVQDVDENTQEIATSLYIDSRDPMEITLSPYNIGAIYELLSQYLEKQEARQPFISSYNANITDIRVINDIGPGSKVSVISHHENEGSECESVIGVSKYDEPLSTPSSPGSSGSHTPQEYDHPDNSQDNSPAWDHISLASCSQESSDLSQIKAHKLLEPSFNDLCPNPINLYQDITKHKIKIEVCGFDPLIVFLGKRSRNRLFQLSPSQNDVRYYIIVMVQVLNQLTTVTVRSPLQVMNDLPIPVNICYKKSVIEALGENLNQLSRVVSPINPFQSHLPAVTLQPEQVYTVPLAIAYNSTLHIQPAATDYYVSQEGVWWKELLNSARSQPLTCVPKDPEHDPAISATVRLHEGIELCSLTQVDGLGSTVPNYCLSVVPPLCLYNHLPHTLSITHSSLVLPLTLDPGQHSTFYKVDMKEKVVIHIEVNNYKGVDWKGIIDVSLCKEDEQRTLTLSSGDGDSHDKLEVGIYIACSGTTSIYVYSPYWIVNKTGLPLKIRGSRSKTVHSSSGQDEILLFRYKRNYPHRLKLCTMDSAWSRRWSCETVGSCGVVVCTDETRNKKYRVLAKVTQSSLAAAAPTEGIQGPSKVKLYLTKIVTLMPYFTVRNLTQRPIMFMQVNDKVDLWYDCQPHQCQHFWPESENMQMVVRQRETQILSQHFHFNSVHSTVLRMDKGRGLVVRVSGVGSHRPVCISFEKYLSGDAPVRLENWCDDIFLRFAQKESNQVILLAPHQSLLYTWDDPLLPRELFWNAYNGKRQDFSAVIKKDDSGNQNVTVTSMRSGLNHSSSINSTLKRSPTNSAFKRSQRQRSKTVASSSDDEENLDDNDRNSEKSFYQKFQPRDSKTHAEKLAIHWVSYRQGSQRVLMFTQSERLAATVSLPRERAHTEICLALDGIGISLINNASHEIAYMSLVASAAQWEIEIDGSWKTPPSLELLAWLEDQYTNNPHSKVNLKGSLQVDLEKMHMTQPFCGRLRRIKQPALWFQYRLSQQFTYAALQIHRLQVDNQLVDAIFPSVLYPNNENGNIQECFTGQILLYSTHSKLTTIKHLSIVTKEFYLKVDKGFLLSLCEMIEPLLPDVESSNIHTQLKNLATPIAFTSMKNCESYDEGPLCERICIAGLRIKFSFSPRGTMHNQNVGTDLLEWFLTSIGATLTEMKNVSVSIGHYERQDISWDNLVQDFKDHAKYQLIQQVYVLILGLDILGNPYQRLRDLSQGVKDLIYQPALGLLEGPDEFGEGVARGAKSLMGHTVGGAADGIGLIASALGNSIAIFSFDDQYRKKRRRHLETSTSIPTTLARASQTFVMGVVYGLSGVVVSPIAGAQRGGVEGFFRGVGRGIMGLITKPSLGVVDSVAMACDAIRRAVDLGYDVMVRSRPPRHISLYFPLRAYSIHEATGLALLTSLNQGRYTTTDCYIAHAPLSDSDQPDITLITDKHIFQLERCGIWGGWEIAWKISIGSLTKQPLVLKDCIVLNLRQDTSICHISGTERKIKCSDEKVLTYLSKSIEVITTLHMEELPCPS